MARHDFGLTWEEFEEITPAMFQALGKRRIVGIKHERFANCLTASVVYNVNRGADDPPITAFDFIRSERSAAKRERVREARKYIKKAIGTLPMMTTTIDKYMEVRAKVIEDLKAEGHSNAEELFNSEWPHLTPKD